MLVKIRRGTRRANAFRHLTAGVQNKKAAASLPLPSSNNANREVQNLILALTSIVRPSLMRSAVFAPNAVLLIRASGF